MRRLTAFFFLASVSAVLALACSSTTTKPGVDETHGALPIWEQTKPETWVEPPTEPPAFLTDAANRAMAARVADTFPLADTDTTGWVNSADVWPQLKPGHFRLHTLRNQHPRDDAPLHLHTTGIPRDIMVWLWASKPIAPTDPGIGAPILAVPTITLASLGGSFDFKMAQAWGWTAFQALAYADGAWKVSDGLYLQAGEAIDRSQPIGLGPTGPSGLTWDGEKWR